MDREPNEGQLTGRAAQPRCTATPARLRAPPVPGRRGVPAGHNGVVYHELYRLERRRLISSQWEIAEGGGPARRVYTVTPAGMAALGQTHRGGGVEGAVVRVVVDPPELGVGEVGQLRAVVEAEQSQQPGPPEVNRRRRSP